MMLDKTRRCSLKTNKFYFYCLSFRSSDVQNCPKSSEVFTFLIPESYLVLPHRQRRQSLMIDISVGFAWLIGWFFFCLCVCVCLFVLNSCCFDFFFPSLSDNGITLYRRYTRASVSLVFHFTGLC